MRHIFCITVLMCMLNCACTNFGSQKLTDSDSAKITDAYTEAHSIKKLQNFVFGFESVDSVITVDSAKSMIEAYEINKFKIRYRNSDTIITNFLLDSTDFPKIMYYGDSYKNLRFWLGIKNFGTYQTDGFKEYTLVVQPILKDTTNPKHAPVAYDFVNPCPGSPGCPK